MLFSDISFAGEGGQGERLFCFELFHIHCSTEIAKSTPFCAMAGFVCPILLC
jgi:hypothetical protein